MKKNEENNYKTTFSILRYAGGKTRASKILVDFIPKDVKKIVSPFFGGGSFEFFLNQNLGIEIIGYDIFDYLTNFWNIILNDQTKKQFIEEFRKIIPTKDFYYEKRKELLNVYKNNIQISNLEKAVLYYFSHQYSYGPMFLGWPSSVYLKQEAHDKIIKKLSEFNPKNIKIIQKSFEESIKNHKNDFLYLDPPYYLSEQSKVFKGIYPNTNWAIHHNNFDHKKLYKLLKEHKGGFLLSYNDTPEIREMYKDFDQFFPEWHYSFSQGEKRIGINKLKNGTQKSSSEILIYKYN